MFLGKELNQTINRKDALECNFVVDTKNILCFSCTHLGCCLNWYKNFKKIYERIE